MIFKERKRQVFLQSESISSVTSRKFCDGDVDVLRDRVLVERFQSGDHKAFDELYAMYKKRVFRLCMSRLGDEDDAEDATQETFVRAWRALQNLDGDKRFYPWLSVIASHICVDVLRKRSRDDKNESVSEVISTEPDPSDRVVKSVNEEFIHKALTRLSDRHQRVLKMREVSELSYEEIANAEGVRISTVESLIFRARQALKREFQFVAGAEGRGGFAVILLSLLRKVRLGIGKLNAKRGSFVPEPGRFSKIVPSIGGAALCASIALSTVSGNVSSKAPEITSTRGSSHSSVKQLPSLAGGSVVRSSANPMNSSSSQQSKSTNSSGTNFVTNILAPATSTSNNLITGLSNVASTSSSSLNVNSIAPVVSGASTSVSNTSSSALSTTSSTLTTVANTLNQGLSSTSTLAGG